MDNETPAIVVDKLHKTFKLPHEQHSSFKQAALNAFKPKTYERFRALNGVSFEVKRGEFFGIIGRNGSGKSTLLKTLAGIYQPDKGGVLVNGKLTPFIELGVGFNPELTGRDNVFLNGTILGLSRKELTQKYNEIVGFAELEKFMDQKLKNYSSGMQVRLAFAIAIQAHNDILLIDEVLAVGDAAFQTKCLSIFRELKKDKAKTVVFVTHDMGNVERFCDRVLLLDRAEPLGVLSPSKARVLYDKINSEGTKKVNTSREPKRWGVGSVRIEKVQILDGQGRPQTHFKQGEGLKIHVKIRSRESPQPILAGLAFYDEDGTNLSGPNSRELPFTSSTREISYEIERLPFSQGRIDVTVALYDELGVEALDYINKGYSFNVTSDKETHGKISLFGRWQVRGAHEE